MFNTRSNENCHSQIECFFQRQVANDLLKLHVWHDFLEYVFHIRLELYEGIVRTCYHLHS